MVSQLFVCTLSNTLAATVYNARLPILPDKRNVIRNNKKPTKLKLPVATDSSRSSQLLIRFVLNISNIEGVDSIRIRNREHHIPNLKPIDVNAISP